MYKKYFKCNQKTNYWCRFVTGHIKSDFKQTQMLLLVSLYFYLKFENRICTFETYECQQISFTNCFFRLNHLMCCLQTPTYFHQLLFYVLLNLCSCFIVTGNLDGNLVSAGLAGLWCSDSKHMELTLTVLRHIMLTCFV